MPGNNGANPYRPVRTEVAEVIVETPTIKTLHLKPEEPIGFEPGQFLNLTVPGVGEAPFTPSSHAAHTELVQLTIMRVGRVTERVHQLQPGDVVGLRGPLGKPYPIDKFRGREVLVVGGGCGFAPLRSLMYAFFDISDQFERLYFRGGCKTPGEMLYRDELEQWRRRPDLNMQLTVDEGDEQWQGPVGVVTTILDDVEMDFDTGIAVVCGPPVMMKFGVQKLLEMGFHPDNMYLSMEKNMSCGVGKCGHCRVGTYYCCSDGPVFTYGQVKDFAEIW